MNAFISDAFCIFFKIINHIKFRKSTTEVCGAINEKKQCAIFVGFVIFVVIINLLKFFRGWFFHYK